MDLPAAKPIDFFIFGGFVLLNIVVGLAYSRHIKSFRQYAIGKRNFSTPVLAASIAATLMSAQFMRHGVGGFYQAKLKIVILEVCEPLSFLLIGWFIVMRMGEFRRDNTIAESIGRLYGNAARLFTVIAGVVFGVGFIALQFQCITNSLKLLFSSVDYPYILYSVGVIFIIYTAWGGVEAVTVTDLIQLTCGFIGLAWLLFLVVQKYFLHDKFSIENINPYYSIDWSIPVFYAKHANMFSLLLHSFWIALPILNPAYYQRFLMTKNTKQAKRIFVYASIIIVFFVLLMWSIETVLMGNSEFSFDAGGKEVFLERLLAIFSNSPGLRGIIVAAIVAMGMSTADSLLNGMSVLLFNDVYKPYKLALPKNFRWLTFLNAIVLGGLSLLLARQETAVKFFFREAHRFVGIWRNTIGIIMFLAILGFRTTSYAIAPAILVGLGCQLSHFLGVEWVEWHQGTCSCIAGIFTLFVAHYALRQPGGFVGIGDPYHVRMARQRRRKRWRKAAERFKKFRLYTYLKQALPTSMYGYLGIGVYILCTTYLALLFTKIPATIPYYCLLPIPLITATLFMTYSLWGPRWQRLPGLPVLWIVLVGLSVFYIPAVLVLITAPVHYEVALTILVMNLLIGLLAYAQPLVYSVFVLSVGLAYLNVAAMCPQLIKDFALSAPMYYALLLTVIFIVVVTSIKKRQKQLARTYNYLLGRHKNAHNKYVNALQIQHRFAQQIDNASLAGLQEAASLSTTLIKKTTKATTPKAQQLIAQDLHALALRLQQGIQHMQQLVYQVKDHMRLYPDQLAMRKIRHMMENIADDIIPSPQIVYQIKTKQKKIQCDPKALRMLLQLVLAEVGHHNDASKLLHCHIADTTLTYALRFMPSGYQRTIPAIAITLSTDPMFTHQKAYPGSDGKPQITPPSLTRGLEKSQAQRIVHAHCGNLRIKADGSHSIILPVRLRDIRPKVVDESVAELKPLTPEETKQGLKVEAAFWQIVEANPHDKKRLQAALDFMKKAHGAQRRKSGKPFYTHPLEVAMIVARAFPKDHHLIIAALLHDTVEDTSVTAPQVGFLFGNSVKVLVEKLTKFNDGFRKTKLRPQSIKAKLVNTPNKEVAILKLADRLHNLRTLGSMPKAKRQAKAQETMNFFVLLADRFGLKAWAKELRKLCRYHLADQA